MKIETNIEQLKKQLLSLGFENGLEQELLFELCFLPETFIVRNRLSFQSDILLFTLHFERVNAGSGYYCKYYDATLRKQIVFDDAGQHAEFCRNLDWRMEKISWNSISTSKDFSISMASEIEAIVEELNRLSLDDTGKELADRLRFKHWSNTNLEYKISITQQMRNRFEITQRFYFFEDETQITVQEAYRFLNNRWLEKQMTSKKKSGDQSPGNDEVVESGGSGSKEKTRKLLPKNSRGRHGKDKSVKHGQ